MAYTINNYNSSINIDLYQCHTNTTIFNSTSTIIDTIFNNQMNSCDVNCCTSNSSNRTTSSNICQVTVQSFEGICLGRLCYSIGCDDFELLANNTRDYKNKTEIMNKINSLFFYIPSPSLVNSTQTKLNSWKDKTGLTIRQTILIILFTVNITLTAVTLIVVIKSIGYANIIADERSYRYTLL